MSQTVVVLKVKMSCGGCSGAVKRVLDKMEGVESYDINMEEQKVTVKGNIIPEAVLETISKTGKKTQLWEETLAVESESVVALDVEPTGTKPEMNPSKLPETETKLPEEVVETETKSTEANETKSTEAVETETKYTTTTVEA